MGVEVLIFRRDESLFDNIRDGGDRHENPPFGRQFRQQAQITGINPAHDRRLVVSQPIDVRQVGAEMLECNPAADRSDTPTSSNRPRKAPRRPRATRTARLRRALGVLARFAWGRSARHVPAIGRQRLAGGQWSCHGRRYDPFAQIASNEIAICIMSVQNPAAQPAG